MWKFEYDRVKSLKNKLKHRIDFEEAQILWLFPHYEFPLEYKQEQRFGVIAKMDGVFWTAVVTKRDDHIRIISVRRSREEEKQEYKSRQEKTNR